MDKTMQADAISRSAAIEWLERYLDPWADRYECCYEIEHEIPALDAVPVVRCKDCIHAVDITNRRYVARFGVHAKQCMRCRGDSGFGYYDLSVVYPDGFCDEGEKRND